MLLLPRADCGFRPKKEARHGSTYGSLRGCKNEGPQSACKKTRGVPSIHRTTTKSKAAIAAFAASVGADEGRKPRRTAKSIGWAIYAAGFVIWLFGYLSAGHAPVFDWVVATPWWISSFVPNLEAELGLALMFASMMPIYGRAVLKRAQWFNR
jgi:hypothetical protein